MSAISLYPPLDFTPETVVNKSTLFREAKGLLIGTWQYWWMWEICRQYSVGVDQEGKEYFPQIDTDGCPIINERVLNPCFGWNTISNINNMVVIMSSPRDAVMCRLLDPNSNYVAPMIGYSVEDVENYCATMNWRTLNSSTLPVNLLSTFSKHFKELQKADSFCHLRNMLKTTTGQINFPLWDLIRTFQLKVTE